MFTNNNLALVATVKHGRMTDRPPVERLDGTFMVDSKGRRRGSFFLDFRMVVGEILMRLQDYFSHSVRRASKDLVGNIRLVQK